jgi:hypothetical protein
LSFEHHRAVFDTGAAPGTKIHIDAASTLIDFDLKIPFFPRNGVHFSESNQFDVDVPADLDQFG